MQPPFPPPSNGPGHPSRGAHRRGSRAHRAGEDPQADEPAREAGPTDEGSSAGAAPGAGAPPDVAVDRPHDAAGGDVAGVAPASAGAELELEALLEQHLPGLQAYVRGRVDRLVQAKESSSDLVQSVCREVIEHMDRFEHRSEAGFKQWLYRTAERKIIDRFRYYTAEKRNAAREAHDLTQTMLSDARGLFYTPSHDAMMREELGRAQAAFESLPEHYQQAIVLSRVSGYSHAEIAAQLGRSEGAVRNLLYRGLAAISDALDGGADRRPPQRESA